MNTSVDLPPATQMVRAALVGDLRDGHVPSAEQVARRVAFSSGHLRRMLRAEGTTIVQIRNELLQGEAIAALRRGEGVDAVAVRLGFSDPRSFRRAFKRWTGTSPATYLPQ